MEREERRSRNRMMERSRWELEEWDRHGINGTVLLLGMDLRKRELIIYNIIILL